MMRHPIFIAALGDFFSPRVLLITLVSLILTLAVFIVGIMLLFGSVETLSSWFVTSLDGLNQSIEQSWFLSLISLFFITKMFVTILFFFTSAFVVYFLFLVVYSTIIGFFSGQIIKEIGEKHYAHIEQKSMSMFAYFYLIAKTIVIAFVFLIVLMPLFLIPILNFVLFIPIFYMFYKMLVLEVASACLDSKEYAQLKARKGVELKGIAFVCFLVTMIPFVGVVLYPYYVIAMSHFIYREVPSLRLSNY